MKGSDIFYVFIIILIFVALFLVNTLTIGMEKIKKNWPEHRCNPSVMPFASYFGHDAGANFTYCIQNMQTGFMGYLLKPTHYAVDVLGSSMSSIIGDVQWIRKKISDLVGTITNVITSIFSVFVNILIQFQRMIIKLKDVFSKVLAIMTTLIYLIESSMLTGGSIMAGPVGETLRFLCFHPETKVQMLNETFKMMKDVEPGETLVNGSKVLASLKIVGNKNDPTNQYYALYDPIHKQNIYVTGSHKIHDITTNRFIPVEQHSDSIPVGLTTASMSCLVTDDHLIPIGSYTFWDWED